MAKKADKECPPHQLLRKGFTTKTGTKVKPVCIEATSMYNKRATTVTAPMTASVLAAQRRAEQQTKSESPTTCPRGTIRRSAYTRTAASSKATFVPAKCITEQGKKDGKVGLYDPNTGERVYVVLEKDILSRHGYDKIKTQTASERHAALDKAYASSNKNWLSIFRTLNYLAVLNKSHKKLHAILIADRNYIKRKYSPASVTT